MSVDIVPKDLRGLRACLVCSLIKVKYCIPLCHKPRYKQAFKEHFTLFFFRPKINLKWMAVTIVKNSCTLKIMLTTCMTAPAPILMG